MSSSSEAPKPQDTQDQAIIDTPDQRGRLADLARNHYPSALVFIGKLAVAILLINIGAEYAEKQSGIQTAQDDEVEFFAGNVTFGDSVSAAQIGTAAVGILLNIDESPLLDTPVDTSESRSGLLDFITFTEDDNIAELDTRDNDCVLAVGTAVLRYENKDGDQQTFVGIPVIDEELQAISDNDTTPSATDAEPSIISQSETDPSSSETAAPPALQEPEATSNSSEQVALEQLLADNTGWVSVDDGELAKGVFSAFSVDGNTVNANTTNISDYVNWEISRQSALTFADAQIEFVNCDSANEILALTTTVIPSEVAENND